MFNKFLTPLTV